MHQWEYLIRAYFDCSPESPLGAIENPDQSCDHQLEEVLNEHGELGWELVTMVPWVLDPEGDAYKLVLKRARQP